MRFQFLIITLLGLIAPRIFAGNVDLSTVPTRDTVQLTIYNSEDITLVRETRKVTFKKGVNPLQFSWANTLIDPTSVELKFLTAPDKLEVLDTTFPREKPQMLYWNVQSDFDGEASIQITYFTSGITWAADYQCVASADEKNLKLEGFVRVTNNSGEDYNNAQVRLVVGTINLVEKIAQLAQKPISDISVADQAQFRSVAVARAVTLAENMPQSQPAAPAAGEPKQIVKEGLSEYFIYTIEGTETIPTGWSKRMRSIEASTVPVRIQYRYRPQEYGDQLVRMYLMTNDEKSTLGTTPLPNGVVRVFRDNGRDGLSFLTAQVVKYIPIGDKIELNLGPDPEVIFELIKQRSWRNEIWMQINGADVFKKIGDGVRVEVNSSVAGWDEHQGFAQRIRNYTSRPIDVEIRRSFDGHVVFRSSLNPSLHDYRTVQFQATVNPAEKRDLVYELVTKQGHNAKQNNVTLETTEVKP
jgi:hypothetical protein